MRLISCVTLLMVIPAVGLLTIADKFADQKMPDTSAREHPVNHSTSLNLFNHGCATAKFDGAPVVFTTDYRLSFFKPIYLHSAPLFTINKIK